MSQYVYATASTRNQTYFQALGADVAIDYTTVAFDTLVDNLDAVIDLVSGDTQERSWACLNPGGFLASIKGGPVDERSKEHGMQAKFVVVQPSGSDLAALAQLIIENKLRIYLDRVYVLADIEKGLASVGTGHVRGKVVMQIVE